METKTKIFLLLLLVNISIFWIIEYPPLQDYPLYLERIFVLHNYNNPEFNFQKYYEINSPTTNLSNELLGLGLINFLPIEIVGKILISITILIFCFGIYNFLEVFHKDNILALSSIFFLYNFLFMFGFLNFVLGTGFFFLILSELFKNGFKNKIKLTAFTTITFISHLIPFLLLITALIIFCIEKKQKLWNLIIFLPSIALLLYFVFFGLSNDLTNSFSFIWGNFAERFQSIIAQFISLSKFNILPTIAFLILALYLIVHQIKNWKGFNPNQRIAFKILIIISLIYLVIPWQTYNWGFMALRLTIFMPIFFFASINTAKINKKIIIFLMGLLLISAIISNFVFMSQANETIKTIIDGKNMIEKNSTVLFLFAECDYCTTTRPLTHFNRFYTTYNGAIVPQTFVAGKYLLVERKKEAFLPSPSEYDQMSFSMEKHGKYYDYIVLFKQNEKLEKEIEKKFTQIYNNGTIRIYKKITNN